MTQFCNQINANYIKINPKKNPQQAFGLGNCIFFFCCGFYGFCETINSIMRNIYVNVRKIGYTFFFEINSLKWHIKIYGTISPSSIPETKEKIQIFHFFLIGDLWFDWYALLILILRWVKFKKLGHRNWCCTQQLLHQKGW